MEFSISLLCFPDTERVQVHEDSRREINKDSDKDDNRYTKLYKFILILISVYVILGVERLF